MTSITGSGHINRNHFCGFVAHSGSCTPSANPRRCSPLFKGKRKNANGYPTAQRVLLAAIPEANQTNLTGSETDRMPGKACISRLRAYQDAANHGRHQCYTSIFMRTNIMQRRAPETLGAGAYGLSKLLLQENMRELDFARPVTLAHLYVIHPVMSPPDVTYPYPSRL